MSDRATNIIAGTVLVAAGAVSLGIVIALLMALVVAIRWLAGLL